MSYICAHCGHTPDHNPIHRGDWELHPTYVNYRGNDVGAVGMQCGALYKLAKLDTPAWVPGELLAVGLSDAEDSRKSLAVKLCQLRAKMGSLFPIQSKLGPGGGYRWAA